MEIPFMQSSILRSQRQQRFIENDNCDGTTRKISKQSSIWKIDCANTKTVTIILLLCFSTMAHGTSDQNCPSICNCAVETVVFCNNAGLRTTPTSFAPNTEKLYLFNNNISRILPGTLKPLKNLKLLDISGNRIGDYALWKGVFNNLTLLENIILQENQITRVTRRMFKGMTQLVRIYLQKNRISVIESGAFDNLPNLVELKLRYNRLVIFPKFQNTPSLLLLDVGYNNLRAITDMALSMVNVEQLLLQSNRLTELRTSVFDDTSRLSHLDISNNKLTAVPQIVRSLESLRTFNMSLNQMITIPKDTFTNLRSLKNLYLRGMGLNYLEDGVIPKNVILNKLDLTDNNWDCRCAMKWMPAYIGVFRPAFVDADQLKCSVFPAYSPLRNRRIQDLTENDFNCVGEDSTVSPPIGSVATTKGSTTTSRNRPPWKLDPCEVFPCFNGGTCSVVGRHPRCRCAPGWRGTQCQVSRRTTTTTTTRKTTKPTTRTTTTRAPAPQLPKLMINPDSVSDHSVEIILPITDTELLVSISEIGMNLKPKEFSIKPEAHPFTVKNLDSGRYYNICIHLPLPVGNTRDPAVVPHKDTLCGSVKTTGNRVTNTPASSKPEITVVPSPGVTVAVEVPVDDTETPLEVTKNVIETKLLDPSVEGKLQGSNTNPETAPTESTDFQLLYPAIGAGIGAVVIIIVIIMFCICRRQKRIMKLKQQNGPDYVSGSPVESNHTDMELATVVHHHHLHNHYTAGSVDSNPTASSPNKKQGSPASKPHSQQSSFVSSKPSPNGIPNGVRIHGRNSTTSSTSSGASLNDRGYSMVHHQPASIQTIQYDPLPPQRSAVPNDYVYRNHQSSADSMVPLLNSHPPPPRPQNLRLTEEAPTLMNGRKPYYGANDHHMYTMAPMKVPSYIPPHGSMSYQTPNTRAVFQPIQSPTILSASSSESMPISPRVSTAHVMPTTAACLNRNLVSDNMPRYHEGVQVV